jgi:NAD(P)-dependent dehydrogenase (short-subunit alcohol dehydrogenase family)
MGQLNGKTALVTGATSGIGLATAHTMTAEGAHVFITGRNQPAIDNAVSAIGNSVTGIRSDITKQDDLDALFEAINARGNGLDVVFANAGGGEYAPLGKITAQHLTDTL